MGVDYNGNLYANGFNELPRNEYVICNIMNTESILDDIDVWNNKNPLYCLETPGTRIEDINIDKEINMLCNKIRHEKNYKLLGVEDTVSNLLFYEMYGNYKYSEVNKFLNNTFYGRIEASVRNLIKEVSIPYVAQYIGGSVTGRCFALSCTELGWSNVDYACYERC